MLLFVVSLTQADEALELFRRAAKGTQETPFQGTMEFQRLVFDDIWNTEFTIEHLPNVATKIVFISPKIVKGNIIIRTNDGIWVTPVSDKKLEKVMDEMESFPWHRLLDNENDLFFQTSLDLEHEKLLLKNYELKTDYQTGKGNSFHISIVPKNKYRPSLECKFNRENLFQRKCKHYNHEKQLDESFAFIDLKMNPSFKDQDFSLDTLKKIHTFDQSQQDTPQPMKPDFMPVALKWLPRGFEMIYKDVWDGKHGITHHSVFSDGFARLSVYQRKLKEKEKVKVEALAKESDDTCVVNRFQRRSEWVYFLYTNDLRISAVGDIAPQSIGKTLSKIDAQ